MKPQQDLSVLVLNGNEEFGRGLIFQNDNKGIINPIKKNGPIVFNVTNKGATGYVNFGKPMKADFHCKVDKTA